MKGEGPKVLHATLSQYGLTADDYGILDGDTQSGPDTNPATPNEFGCANHKMEVCV
jgi:hypothetical protein